MYCLMPYPDADQCDRVKIILFSKTEVKFHQSTSSNVTNNLLRLQLYKVELESRIFESPFKSILSAFCIVNAASDVWDG